MSGYQFADRDGHFPRAVSGSLLRDPKPLKPNVPLA